MDTVDALSPLLSVVPISKIVYELLCLKLCFVAVLIMPSLQGIIDQTNYTVPTLTKHAK